MHFKTELKNSLPLSLSILLSSPFFCCSEAFAQSATGSNLDLSSVTASMTSKNKAPVSLQVGGSVTNGKVSGGDVITIQPGQMVTPAQYLAIFGAMRGNQTLLLDASGAASGGSFNLSSRYVQNLSGLQIPGGVAVNAIGYNQATPLNVSGNVNLLGSMYTLQTMPNIMSVLNMGNLNIGVGGLLSGYLPAGMNIAGLYSSAGMQLNVAGNVINQGTITTPGALNIIAGGNIVNQSVNAAQAVMAAQNINLTTGAGSLFNSGLIQAMNSLNINTMSPNVDLNINNTSGILQAINAANPLSGVINIREDGFNLELASIDLTGGKLDASGGINLYGKNMEVHVDSINGAISNKGSVAHVDVKEGNLTLGRQILSGDPSYYNNAGDITIADLTSVAGDLAIVASGNIITTGDTVITASAGSSVYLSAGFNFSIGGGSNTNNFPANDPGDTTNTLTFDGTSNAGQNINAANKNLSISTSGAGNITLVSTGTISIGSGDIKASGTGNILIIGEGGFSQTTTGKLPIAPIKGTISTNSGSIDILASKAIVANGTTITNGTVSALPLVGATTKGPITTGLLSSTSGSIGILTDSDITLTRGISTGGGANIGINSVSGKISGQSYITNINNSLQLINVPITLGNGNLNILAAGAITLDSYTTTGAPVAIIGGSVDIAGASGSATDTTTITANTGDITNSDFLTTGNLTLSAPNGIIGAPTSAFFTTSPIVSATAKGNMRILDAGISVGSFSATSTTGSVFLQTNDNVTLSSNISGPTGVTLILFAVFPSGILTMGGNQIITNNGPVLISANGINFGGTTPINAGTGDVSILPVSPLRSINLGTATGGLDFSEAVLNGITAGSLTLGSLSTYGNINVGGTSLNLTQPYDLILLQGDGLDDKNNHVSGAFNGSGVPINIATTGGGFSVQTTSGAINVAKITNNSTTNALASLITGNADINLDGTNGASIPVGHDIRLIAGGTKAVNGLPIGTALVLTPVRDGNDGGNAFIRSNNLLTAGGPSSISIDVSALGANGNGGIASVERTATSTIDAKSSIILLNISGGSSTGNQGTAIISNGGNLTVDIAGGSVVTSVGTSTDGNGPSFNFTAGSVGPGKLLVTSSLNSNGIGTGKGGSISLNSNSTTPFVIGVNSSTNTNGIRGTFTVTGSVNGDVSISNHGGGITNKVVDLSMARNLTLDTTGAKNGTLSVFTQPLSGPNTVSLNLLVGGSATINPGTVVLQADTINLLSENGAITAKIDTDNISANSNKGNIALTSAATTPINLMQSIAGTDNGISIISGGTLSLMHGGNITTSGDVMGSSVTLKSTGTANNTITLGGNVIALGASGKVTLTATGSGSITDTGLGTSIQGLTISLNSDTGTFGTGGLGEAGALFIATTSLSLNSTGAANLRNLNGSNLTITAAKTTGTLALRSFGGLTITPSIVNVDDFLFTSSSSKGNIVINGSLGNSTTTNSIVVTTSGGNITGNGTLITGAGGTVTLTAGTVETESSIGTASVPLKVNTPAVTLATTKGVINLSSVGSSPITVGNMVTEGVVKYSAKGDSTFGSNVQGESVTLKLVGNNNFTGSILASTGALSLTQTGVGVTNIGTALSSGTTMSLTTAGTLFVGNTVTVGGNLTVKTGGTTTFADTISSTGAVTVTQNVAAGSVFGNITGKSITLNLKRDNSNAVFNGDLTANTTTVKINETGTTTGNTVFNAGADISAKTGVTITTVGGGTFRAINSGVGGTGSVVVKTKGTTDFLGMVSADADFAGTGTVSLTQTGGAGLFVEGGFANGNTYTVSSSGTGGITTGVSDINATLNVLIKNTGSGTNAGIALGGDVVGGAGTVTLTATGTGSITQTAGKVTGATALFTSGTGDIGSGGTPVAMNLTKSVSANTKGLVNLNNTNSGTLTLTAAGTENKSFKLTAPNGSLVINPTLAKATSIDISSKGSITLKGGTLGSVASTTGPITLTSTTGNITGNSAISTSATGSVMLSAAAGNLGTSTAPLKISTLNLVGANAFGTVNLSNISNDATGATYGTITGSDVKIATANKSTFNGNITTSGAGTGSIKITQTTGLLTLGPAVQFHAQGSVAQITLQEKADKAGSGIVLANGVMLESDVPNLTKIAGPTTFPRLGQISIVVGGTIPAPTNNLAPSGITVNTQPTDAFFGTNPGTITATTTNINITGNTAVQMQSGKTAGITLNNNIIDADPPIAPAAPVAVSENLAQTNQVMTQSLSAENTLNVSGSGIVSSSTPPPSIAIPVSTVNNILNPSMPKVLQGGVADFASGSDEDGEAHLDAILLSDKDLGLNASTSEIDRIRLRVAENSRTPIEVLESPHQSSRTSSPSENVPSGGSLRTAGGSPAHGATRRIIPLTHGSAVLVPFVDTTVKTPFGDIEIDARSIALLMISSDSASIFNLDDQHRDAVVIQTGTKKLSLAPGRHVLLTRSGKSFESLNPAESIAYRNIESCDLDNGMRAHNAEFSIPSAISSVKPLKRLFNSKHPEAAKLSGHLRKTVAAMLHMNRNAERYQQVTRPRMAAYSN